jgi:glycosyltransferase involved in cell wall biosynthesis
MDAVVVVSDPLVSTVLSSGVASTKVVVIRNAWAAPGAILARDEARRRLGLQADLKVVGWLGRFTREKAPDLAVRAMSMVRDPAVTLCLLGAGPLESELQALAQHGVGAHRVRIHPPIAEAWAYLKAFDAICLSSSTEGTPMVLLEAMAAEVPIVTTSVGGIPDVVGEEHALLVPSGDPALLARALERALTEDQRPRVAAAAARVSAGFGPGPWVSRYEELYRSLSAGEESA